MDLTLIISALKDYFVPKFYSRFKNPKLRICGLQFHISFNFVLSASAEVLGIARA